MKFSFQRMDYTPCPDGETPDRFGIECPRQPGRMCGGMIISGVVQPDGTITGKEKDSKKSWAWNGNRSAPTFKPSINCLAHNPRNPAEKYAGCGAHGFVTDGKWKDS